MTVTALLPLQIHAASFNCAKAKSWAEKTVCNTGQLSSLDDLLAISFKKALESTPDKAGLKAAQLDWLRHSRDNCKDTECLQQTYTSRIAALNETIPPANEPTAEKPPNNENKTVKTDGRILEGVIESYDCGDNCYLTITDAQGEDHAGLCTAPLCQDWNANTEMPASFKNRKVKVTIGTGKQIDASGNVMGEMDSFDDITLLK
jgi:uncharacterized protein